VRGSKGGVLCLWHKLLLVGMWVGCIWWHGMRRRWVHLGLTEGRNPWDVR